MIRPPPDQLEAEVLVDQIVGVQLHPLKDEIVEDVQREERGVDVDARICLLAKEFVVIISA